MEGTKLKEWGFLTTIRRVENMILDDFSNGRHKVTRMGIFNNHQES
jgi:hypothetical protein